MQILLGKTAGFCFGVENAISKAKRELEIEKEVYCLGEIVHNKEVIKELSENGLKFVDRIEKAKNKVIIRAHGAEKKTYEIAEQEQISILDLTCPKVLRIHSIAEKYRKDDFYIFLIGKKEHPENIATISFCGNNSFIIEEETDINKAIEKYNKSQLRKLLVISQTTYSLKKFNQIAKIIENNLEGKCELVIKNTICDTTKLRQEETEELASKVELMIIIGGKNSSNTNKLYEIACKYCKKVVHIENKEEFEKEKLKDIEKVGIMAGASTPRKSIEEVVDMIKNL